MRKKAIYIYGSLAMLTVTIFCAFSIADDDDFNLAKQEIMLRKIGHELLLQSGDSISRVLPVKKLADHEYQLTFENEFTFKSDSLVAIIKRSLAAHHLNQNYVVNVLNCEKEEVIFGYAILGSVKDDIIACSGRKQPVNCYFINIKFQEKGITNQQKGYLFGGLPVLAFVGLLLSRSASKSKRNLATSAITFGNTFYNEADKTITIDEKTISLTSKENKLLAIFANSPNIIIERSRLQKEIWEDEGVIVGRSLDVFISRLRKKLESDTSIQLINIHNRGYKLEVFS